MCGEYLDTSFPIEDSPYFDIGAVVWEGDGEFRVMCHLPDGDGRYPMRMETRPMLTDPVVIDGETYLVKSTLRRDPDGANDHYVARLTHE